MIERLKYVSRFARPMDNASIDAIVRQACANNEREGLTGVLLAFGGIFMQILEGPPDALQRVFDRIERDDRHCDVIVVRRKAAPTRLFGSWSMRLLELGPEADKTVFPLIAMIQNCARGSTSAGAKLFALDDAVWCAFGERAMVAAQPVQSASDHR